MNQRVCVVCKASVFDSSSYTKRDGRIESTFKGRPYYALVCGTECRGIWQAKTFREQLDALFGSWKRGWHLVKIAREGQDHPGTVEFMPDCTEVEQKPPTDEEKQADNRAGLPTHICLTPDNPNFPWRGCASCRRVSVSWIERPHDPERAHRGASR